MKILLGAMPDVWADTLEKVLEPLGSEVQRYSQGSEIPQNEEVLLFYSRPEYAIEAAIVDGKDIHGAIEDWIQAAGELLKFFRRNRKRLKLMHGPSVLDLPKEFCEFFNNRFQLSVHPDDIAAVKRPEVDKTVFQVIAAQAVASSVKMKDLSGELEASALPLGNLPPEYRAEWQKAYEELKQENTQPNKELQEENELLLLQLHQVQEELESYYLEAKDLREQRGGASSMEMDELLSYAVMLEHQYTKLLKSRSWKLMAPMREAGRLVKSLVRRKRVPRNRLPKRPSVLADEPVGGRYGKRTRV